MAEAAAVVGLIESIASLIDFSAKVASQLREFASKTSDVPESFHALTTRLPLLNSSLQFIAHQVQAGRLANDVVSALQLLITSTSTQVSVLRTWLLGISPLIDTSQVQRAVKAPKRLVMESEVTAAVEKTHEDIDFLVLHQATQHVDTGDRLLDELAKLQLAPVPSLAAQRGHQFPNVSACDRSTLHLGDVYNFTRHQEPYKVQRLGLCLGLAPLIDPNDFIGRTAELNAMVEILQPGEASVEQRRSVLGGMGGTGKTQLAIAYARRHQRSYESVFWLNATSESTLNASFRSVARAVLQAQDLENLNDKQVLARAYDWLLDTRNTRWLLIFDNYDNPDQFDIDSYCPNTGHGSIIVTTRLLDLVHGRQVRVQPFTDIDESLDILQTRSKRKDIKYNPDARSLVERLGGLPLALATAGAYLRKSSLTFQQYLYNYERRWNLDPRKPLQLREYQDRTLYTTWNLSYTRLKNEDPEAAQALKLLAYFDHQEIWYELLRAGVTEDLPTWLQDSLADRISFESVIRTLVDYCLIEVQAATESYSIHSCVHDWTLAELNKVIDRQLYWYAVDCVVASADDDWYSLEQLRYARLARHAVRLTHRRFDKDVLLDGVTPDRPDEVARVAELLFQQVQLTAAEQMYLRALTGREKAFGPGHTSTLDTVNNLGNLYADQGKLDAAEQMYERALAGREKALGPDHISTLLTVNNLGNLYAGQGKLDVAEQMYERALAGREKALGPGHTSTLDTVNDLGNLYADQGKLDAAEQMYKRALAGSEKALGPDHTLTLRTVHNLGLLYADQGKLDAAEQMYLRALAGYEKALGPDHTSTLDTVYNLGILYAGQGKLDAAEQMYLRALAGYEKALGPDHTSTLDTVYNLGNLYAGQGKLDAAEQMYKRALAGREKALGPDHTSTLNTVNNLGILYADQGKLEKAEQMFIRALVGFKKMLGVEHKWTCSVISNLDHLHYQQGRIGSVP